jgi:hypothetical protein
MATSKDFKVKNGLNVNSTSILKATGTNYTDGALLILDSTGSTTAAITNNGSGLYISKDTVGSVAAISLLSTGINLTGNVITTGSIQTKAPTISSLITGATSGAIEIPVVANISVPTHATFLHQTTGVSTGYIQHVSLGSYRSGGPGWDSFYIGIGGNDAYPTNKFSFGFDGSLIHSGTGTFLNASNYNTWAPSLTGVGASGTWNINTNGAHNGTVGATAPNTGVFTTIATSGNVTIGTSSSINSLYINGTGSGTDGGAASVVQNNGTPVIAIGNKSALMGGTYNATPMLYGVTAIETNVGLTVGGTITTGIIAASTVTAVLTKNQFDPSFHLSSKSGVNLGAAGSEMARFGLNYNNSWDSFTQYLRGSSSQNGSQVLWAGNTSVVTVTSTGISVVGAINTNNKICVTADTTTPTDGSAYFYKSSTGSVVSGYQVILETGSAGSRTTKATLDNNGNFVLGNITASAWNTAAGPALQIDHASISHAGGFDVTDFSTNAYFVYGTGYKYIGNAIATKYTQTAGRHRFYSSVSGTANTIVSFIEGMNLDENSKLNIRGELAAGTGLNSANFSLSGVPVLGVNAGTGINYLRGDTLEFQNNAGNVTRAILKDTGLSVTSVYDPTITRITNPGGGSYVTGIASVTGALKIVLPVGMTGTMIRMTIKVYEYNSAGSFEINCGGYNYPTGNTWANNPFAYIINTPGVNRNYNVRFGYTAGGKAVIYIGELNTVWNYPQVFVTDVQLGYGGYGTPFATGWVVGVEPTAFENVTTTVSNTQVSLPSSVVGSALGVAAVGSSMAYARADHVHQIPANVVAAGAAGFMTGADKTKLDGIATGANNYTHPANHAPSIITQDASNRFVTDAEKTTWNAKQSALGFNPVQQGTGTNQGSNLIKMGWGTGPNTGKVALTIDSTDFGYTWPININGGASMLTNSRTINRTAFNGTANIECTEWFHSGRDFPLGTTIYTDINYANTDGDPFVLEIKGNSYGNLKPFDIQYQGYIYSNSVINHGGISNGTNIPGLVLLNVGGLLTFWFPTMGYWQGFNVRVYRATLSGSYNAVTSIVNSAKPTGTKEVALSANIVQSWHSGNLTISGVNTGDQTTITGNAGSATKIISQGSYAAAAVGTTRGPAGINLFDNYGGGYPIPYGNVLHIAGGGGGQLLVGWSGSDGAHADNYVRSKRDNDTGAWSPWAKIYTDVNLTNLNQLANGPGYATGGGTASGTNTGDETLATIKSKLGITTLSGANTGDQTNITGSAGSAARLSEQTAYTMLHATLPTATPMGATVTFVGPAVGEGTWPNYGSLVHIRSYASGGGTMQMLAPYGVSQGGTGLKIRFGDYDTNGGNAWTAWKTVWDSVNLTNLNQLTNGPGYITSAGSISGTAAYATAISGVASQIGYSTSAVAIAYTSTGGPQIMGQSTGAAMLSFHRPGAYAINFGLDTDNVLKVGGWSAGAVSYKIWHEGNDGAGSGLDADLLDGQSSAYYQAALVSGTNIKTINGTTLLGSGNIVVSASAATSTVLGTVYANMDISSNCAVGYEALWYNTGSNGCTAFGIGALRANTTGSYNAALGNNALRANTTGSYNVAIGINALSTNTTGNNNLAIGYRALRYNTTGQSNIAFGYDSLTANTIGNNNLAIGNYALLNNTTGINNTAIGYQSLQMNTTGIYNTGIGIWTLKNNTIGTYNLAVGESSLTSNTTGSNNTAIGVSSLFSNTTGSNNTAIGRGAGTLLTTGVNNTIIGFGANSASETTSNSITLGNASITSLRCNVQSISALSDKRDKTGIVDIGLGMEFISTLKPVKFHWDRREWYTDGVSDGTKSITEFDYGFIAQDLKAAQEAANVPDLNLVLQDNPDRLEATPGRLLPIMVKALQEANTRIEKLEALVAQLLAK